MDFNGVKAPQHTIAVGHNGVQPGYVDNGWVYVPVYKVSNSEGKTVYDMGVNTLQVGADETPEGVASRTWEVIGLAPVHQDVVKQHRQQVQILQQGQKLESFVQENAPNIVVNANQDSDKKITKDRLRNETKAAIDLFGSQVTEKLDRDIASTKARVLGIQNDGSQAFIDEGEANALLEPSKAGQEAEKRKGLKKANRFQAAQERIADEMTQEQQEAKVLAQRATISAKAVIDYVYNNDGKNPIEVLDQKDVTIGQQNAKIGQLETQIAELKGRVKEAHADGKASGSFQKKLLTGALVLALVGLVVAGGLLAHGQGFTPLQNIQLTAQQVKILEYAGIGVAALGVGAGTIYAVKKGAPVVWGGVKKVAAKIAS
jgi:hypothetical protein